MTDLTASEPRETLIRRLRYRSWHRGCKETDILLGPFADVRLESLTDSQLYEYEQILEENDWDIWAWVTDKQPLPARLDSPLMRELLAFRPKLT